MRPPKQVTKMYTALDVKKVPTSVLKDGPVFALLKEIRKETLKPLSSALRELTQHLLAATQILVGHFAV